jgi:hypothetical protein
MADSYIVICRDDTYNADTPEKYELATKRLFDTLEEAEKYAATITSRDPIVFKRINRSERPVPLRVVPARSGEEGGSGSRTKG